MGMRAEQLFDAITGIGDAYITDAENHCFTPKNLRFPPRMRRWTAAAAALVLAAGLGTWALDRNALPGGKTGSGGNEAGSAYMAYAGPVFPLDTAEAVPALEAQRSVTLDLSPYEDHSYIAYDGSERTRYDRSLLVTDTAVLTNTGSDTVTFTAVYPFYADLFDGAEPLPAVTVGGIPVDTVLQAGDTLTVPGLGQPDSWQSLAPLLADGSYRAAALEDTSDELLRQPVTVYEIAGLRVREGTEHPNPVLDLSFIMDPAKTSVFTWGSTGGTVTVEEGRCSRHFDVYGPGDRSSGQSGYLIVLGEDITGLRTQGYTTGIAAPGEETADVTADILRYESTLGEMLELCLAAQQQQNGELFGAAAQSLPREKLLALTAQALDTDADWPGAVEDAFARVRSDDRMLYLCFPLTLAAGESRTVTVTFSKTPSYDHFGDGAGRDGYDLVTQTLHLFYTAQTAVLRNFGAVELLYQNFGFDPAAGVLSVPLTAEHYAIEVAKKE